MKLSPSVLIYLSALLTVTNGATPSIDCDREAATLFGSSPSRRRLLEYYRVQKEPCPVRTKEGLDYIVHTLESPCEESGLFRDGEQMSAILDKALDLNDHFIMDSLMDIWYGECSLPFSSTDRSNLVDKMSQEYPLMSGGSRRLFPYYLRLLNRVYGKGKVIETLMDSHIRVIPANLVPAMEVIVEGTIYDHPDVLRAYLASYVSDEGAEIARKALENPDFLDIFHELWYECMQGNQEKCTRMEIMPMTVPVFLRYVYLTELSLRNSRAEFLARQAAFERYKLLPRKTTPVPDAVLPQLIHVVDPHIFIVPEMTALLLDLYVDLSKASSVQILIEAFETAVNRAGSDQETLNLLMASGKGMVNLIRRGNIGLSLLNSSHVHMLLCSDEGNEIECPTFMVSNTLTLRTLEAVAAVTGEDNLSNSFVRLIQNKFSAFWRNGKGSLSRLWELEDFEQKAQYCMKNEMPCLGLILDRAFIVQGESSDDDSDNLSYSSYHTADEMQSPSVESPLWPTGFAFDHS